MTYSYNASMADIEMPDRIKHLPISPKGYPTPWFVAWTDGVPDFRVADAGKMRLAVRHKRCWTCGEPLGRTFGMLLGPMCCINRTISEPPSHRDCAIFSARACPFLSNPRMRRNEIGLPEDRVEAAGIGIKRNPGAIAVWMTRGYQMFKPPGGGVLFTFDDPEEVLWFAHGRAAMRDEVEASIFSGMPLLEEAAATDGPDGIAALKKMTADAMRFLPPAEVAA